MKLIMENWRGYINEQDSLLLFEQKINEEIDILINEGVLDVLKTAYERTRDGAIRLKDKISDAAAAAMEKVNDFFLRISMKAIELAKNSVESLKRAFDLMQGAISRFKESHPVLFKVAVVILFMLVIFGIMMIFSGNAQAAIQTPGGRTLSQVEYEAMRGMLDVASQKAGAANVDRVLEIGKALKALDAAHQSGTTEQLAELAPVSQNAFKVVTELIQDVTPGVQSKARRILQGIIEIGRKLDVTKTGM